MLLVGLCLGRIMGLLEGGLILRLASGIFGRGIMTRKLGGFYQRIRSGTEQLKAT